jgi:hypothetical protein
MENFQTQRSAFKSKADGILANFRGQRESFMSGRNGLGLRNRIRGLGLQGSFVNRFQTTRAAPLASPRVPTREVVLPPASAPRQTIAANIASRREGGLSMDSSEGIFGGVSIPKTTKSSNLITGRGY